MSSSTTDATPIEQESQDQAVPSDVETSKLSSLRSETSEAESLDSPGITLDQPCMSDQSIPDMDSCYNDATPSVDASVRLQGHVDDKILVDSASKETEPSPETAEMEQVIVTWGSSLPNSKLTRSWKSRKANSHGLI